MSEAKPIPIALKVPWQVEAAISALHLKVDEFNGNAYLRLNVALLPKIYLKPMRFSEYATVEMIFDAATYTQTASIGYFDYTKIDWSGVYPPDVFKTMDEGTRINNITEYEKHSEIWHKQWVEEQICGAPSAYIVQNSTWSNKLDIPISRRLATSYNHYLILGHDMYAEIVATDFTWRIQTEQNTD